MFDIVLVRDCPFSAIYWISFEKYRGIITGWRGANIGMMSSAGLTFLSGVVSGLTAALITHPFDVLKTQSQVYKYRVMYYLLLLFYY